MPEPIRLGLIGDNIGKSLSPRLHGLAARQNNRDVVYDRLVPAEYGMDFETLLAGLAARGYHGVNVTYPYKERAARRVTIDDPLVSAIGAVNTVLLSEGSMHGFNTDYSGFINAYRRVRGDLAPGPVMIVGAGGVGRAIAFALIALGVEEVHIVDNNIARADALADALAAMRPGLLTVTGDTAESLAAGVCGLVNCSPIGMVGHEGTPLPDFAMANAAWAFDAVYTPVETQFLRDAAARGLQVISGYELFIGQGIDAWQLFTGLPVDEAALRTVMSQKNDGPITLQV